jgi:uncharacterized protein YxeA
MKKTIKTAIVALCLLISASAFSQSKQQVDSVALWNKHIDSVLTHTSIAQFNKWVEDNVSVTQYKNAKFSELYNAYVQYQMQLFLQPKSQPKK